MVSKQWLFRVIALLLPIAFLCAIEALLRIGGYGYPAGFFLRNKLDHSTVMVENPKFGWRFFPKSLSRQAVPFAFMPQKAPHTYRIFVFGESAAQGHPEPAYSFARIVAVLLQAKHPETRFEVINTAMTAINSHVIRLIAKDCAKLDGDLWIIYMGHNEVIGPFGAGAVFGSDTPNQTLIHANLTLQSTRVGQLLRNGMDHLAAKKSTPIQWGGLEMFGKTKILSGDPRLDIVRRHFEKNLNDILNTAQSAGVQTLVCIPASNLADCAPFGSSHNPGLSPGQLAQCKEQENAGIEAEKSEKWSEAEAAFSAAIKIDPQFAETQYQLGHCFLKLNQTNQAMEHLTLARDFDAVRLRADSAIARIISETAGKRKPEWVHLLDAEKPLSIGTDNAGEELFYEHVHLTFAGNYTLARLVADEVEDMLPDKIKARTTQPSHWLSEQECANRLAWTPWDRLRVGREMADWLRTGPFTNQSDHLQRDSRWENNLRQWASEDQKYYQASTEIYQDALKNAPNDWIIHANFARLLEGTGDLERALREWVEVSRLLPPHAQFYAQAGNLLDRRGKTNQAEAVFLQALQIDPDSAEASSGLGLALAHQGRYLEAVESYKQALKRKPDSVECHINLGLALLKLGDTNAAIGQEETAIRLWPANVSARINLGKIRQARGDLAAALSQFQEATRIEPNSPLAHFNLANVLVALGKRWEAIQHYKEAARLRPEVPEIRAALASQLRLEGKLDEASRELSTAARLDPGDPETHFQFGSVLFEQGKTQEASAQLRQTLELNPAHTGAAQLLSKIKQ
jgi:tetratricopeptide (TPR) repeat protein